MLIRCQEAAFGLSLLWWASLRGFDADWLPPISDLLIAGVPLVKTFGGDSLRVHELLRDMQLLVINVRGWPLLLKSRVN